MEIVMHCVYYPPEVGGLESHVHHLCRALVSFGHRVSVVTSHSIADTPPHEVLDGVEVWRTWFPGKSKAGWVAHAAGSVPRTLRLARDADVLHAQAFQSIPPLQIARARFGAPLVTTLHTSHFLRLAERRSWQPVLRRLVGAAQHNLAASREIADVAEQLRPSTRVEALTNGVDTELFRPGAGSMRPLPDGRRRLIVPRRLFPKNGVEYFVRAMPRLVETSDVEAVLIGDGPERARLERLANDLGVLDRLSFAGAHPHEDMPALLNSGHVAVFPSLMEATSVAALECLSCGVPVAASRVGGLPEIVDEEVGTLFEPGNPEDLALRVSGLLARADLPQVGERARRRVVARWSNERLARRHEEIYQSLLNRPTTD